MLIHVLGILYSELLCYQSEKMKLLNNSFPRLGVKPITIAFTAESAYDYPTTIILMYFFVCMENVIKSASCCIPLIAGQFFLRHCMLSGGTQSRAFSLVKNEMKILRNNNSFSQVGIEPATVAFQPHPARLQLLLYL